ncbi:unnamed protein product [Sympodiomycopsis kandeliae]
MITLLFFRQGSSADIKLTAIRIKQSDSHARKDYGSVVGDGTTSVVVLAQDTNVHSTKMANWFRCTDILALFWELVGDIEDSMAFVHVKDLVSPVKTSTTKRKEISERQKRSLMAAVASIASKPETRARWWQETTCEHQEFCHLYHATRGKEQTRWLSTLREVPPWKAAESDHDLGSARNAVVLPHDAHKAFDAKKAFILAYPNAGFLDKDTPRPYAELFSGVDRWTDTTARNNFERLGAAQQTEWVACDLSTLHALGQWEDTTYMLSMDKADDDVDREIIRSCGPPASHVGYAAGVRFWERPNMLHGDVFEMMRQASFALIFRTSKILVLPWMLSRRAQLPTRSRRAKTKMIARAGARNCIRLTPICGPLLLRVET